MTGLKESILIHQINDIYKRKGYEFFSTKDDYNLNIVGIRHSTRESNKFDDALFVIYGVNKYIHMKSYEITTDPGLYWLKNPMNKKGTAILAPGQYKNCYAVGMHKGRYDSLIQVKPVEVYRDNNMDDRLDTVNKERGIFGINIHRSNPYTQSKNVDKWSAGCQVLKRKKDYDDFMLLVSESYYIHGKFFTYTLLEESDFY